MKPRIIFTTLLLFLSLQSRGQVLISLIFGDKLNSEHVEFGLDGGFNSANLDGINSSSKSFFNLGFYFDIHINKSPKWLFGTGVLVKSSMGAENIDVYSLGDPDLDEQFKDGQVTRQISYFNVPITIKRKIYKGLYLGAGPMLGLKYKADDYFSANPLGDGKLSYKQDIKDDIKSIDAGLLASLQYKLGETQGMSIFIKYYHGMLDINKGNLADNQRNKSWYLGVTIPVNGIKSENKK